MFTRTLLRTGFAALICLSVSARAADDTKKAADAPKAETKTETVPAGRGKLVKPFSDLKDLSSEQTSKIKAIHNKYLAEINELKAKDHDESMAVLTDDQKKELGELTAKTAADKKTATAAKKKETSSAAESK